MSTENNNLKFTLRRKKEIRYELIDDDDCSRTFYESLIVFFVNTVTYVCLITHRVWKQLSLFSVTVTGR